MSRRRPWCSRGETRPKTRHSDILRFPPFAQFWRLGRHRPPRGRPRVRFSPLASPAKGGESRGARRNIPPPVGESLCRPDPTETKKKRTATTGDAGVRAGRASRRSVSNPPRPCSADEILESPTALETRISNASAQLGGLAGLKREYYNFYRFEEEGWEAYNLPELRIITPLHACRAMRGASGGGRASKK